MGRLFKKEIGTKMKKYFKKEILISFIVGVILASGIVVYATNYMASQVTYKDGKTVEYALNDLYTKSKTVATTKTLLWTNPSPTQNFEAQDITLSSSTTGFTHILIQWKSETTLSTVNDDIYKITPNRTGQGEEARFVMGILDDSCSKVYARNAYLKTSNTIHFRNSSSIAASGTDNKYIIPIYIYGLNFSY